MNVKPVILVTGSSRGLGRGIAQCLAGGGYSVAINYAGNAEAADETLTLCKAAAKSDDQQFLTVQADVTSATDRARMLDEDNIIDIKACQTMMRVLDIEQSELPSFIEQVPFAPAEIERLESEQGFTRL